MHDSRATAYCAETATGELHDEHRVNRAGQVYSSALLAGDRIYDLTRSGRTVIVQANTEFEQLADNDPGDRSPFNGSFAVDGNRLFVRSDRWLYCIEDAVIVRINETGSQDFRHICVTEVIQPVHLRFGTGSQSQIAAGFPTRASDDECHWPEILVLASRLLRNRPQQKCSTLLNKLLQGPRHRFALDDCGCRVEPLSC